LPRSIPLLGHNLLRSLLSQSLPRSPLGLSGSPLSQKLLR
jgi:hypothetical protein